MSATESKVDMGQLREAVRKVFAFTPSPKSEQEEQRTQRKDRQPSLVKGSKVPYKPKSASSDSRHDIDY